MINFIRGIIVGISIAGIITALSFAVARDYDPCDKPYLNDSITTEEYQKRYLPNDDPSMQFYWRDHQPSLQPK